MGTNYYAHIDCCDKCGRAHRDLHIGKSSGGWCFLVRTYPLDEINDWPDWERELSKPNVKIDNEYGETVTIDELRDTVTNRSWGPITNIPRDAVAGPNGLLRHALHACDKHGNGTWDCYSGEFS